MKFSRRGFVKFSAGTAAGLGCSGFSLKVLGDLNEALSQDIRPPNGPESRVNSLCQLCPGGCGLQIRKVGSRAVGVGGNANSPVNRGGVCPIGLCSLQYLYHPERLKYPLKKDGESWQEISWEVAIGEISERLHDIVAGGESRRVVAVSHQLSGSLKRIAEDLLQGLGSNNLVQLSGPVDGVDLAVRVMQGVQAPPAYDLANSNFVLSMGCEILEDWKPPVWSMMSFSDFRGKRPRGGLTYAGSRGSVTASKADSWIRLRPGSEAAFALGVAYVLLSERLYDFDFVNAHCEGFEDWRNEAGELVSGFRRIVLEQYPLNRASELTGVAPEQILRVARDFGNSRPALALGPPIETVDAHSVLTALCVHSLNALVGSIDRPGGVLLAYPDPLDPDGKEATIPEEFGDFKDRVVLGEDPLQSLERVLKRPNPPPALLLLETDPVLDSQNPDELSGNLSRIPLLVSFSSFVNSSSRLADYILPTCSSLESWAEQASPPGVSFTYHGLAGPVVEPVGESRSCGDGLLALARGLELPVPGESYESLVKDRLQRLYELRRGAVAGTVFDQLWHQLMEQSGWWAPTYETPGELLEQMSARGGWWDSFYSYEDWGRTLRTSSGRFRFHVPEALALREEGQSAPEIFGLPHFELAVLEPMTEEYPLLLTRFNPLVAESRQPAMPLLREIQSGHTNAGQGLWIELAEEDASHLGIHSGDRVWVVWPGDRLQAYVQISSGAEGGTVNMPRRVGRYEGGFWDVDPSSEFASAPLREGTRVRIVRVEA